MQDFFASGRAADLILLIMLAELVWLIATKRLSAAEAIALIGPGLLIVLGLRAALVGAGWMWVAAPLALAFPLHLFDLRRRLTSSRRA